MMSVPRPSHHAGLTPDEAAAQWLARQQGEMSASDQAAFEAWLTASQANGESYRRASLAYGLFDAAGDDPHVIALRRAAREAGPRRRLFSKFAVGLAAAASLAGALWIWPQHTNTSLSIATIASPRLAPDGKTFSTGKGERRVIKLADGSVITLNTDSAVIVDFSKSRRDVRLERGQALFEVAKDARRPFIVEAIDRQVTALGTVFEIRLDPGRMKVLLVEGKVVVEESDSAATFGLLKPTLLHNGQALTASLGAAQEVSDFDADTELLWRDGFIEFDDELLGSAVAEINRYAERPLILRDPAVATLRVSGVFRTDSAERFALVASQVLPVRTRRTEAGQTEILAQ